MGPPPLAKCNGDLKVKVFTHSGRRPGRFSWMKRPWGTLREQKHPRRWHGKQNYTYPWRIHVLKLLGGWTNPFEKYNKSIWIIPRRFGLKITHVWSLSCHRLEKVRIRWKSLKLPGFLHMSDYKKSPVFFLRIWRFFFRNTLARLPSFLDTWVALNSYYHRNLRATHCPDANIPHPPKEIRHFIRPDARDHDVWCLSPISCWHLRERCL